MYSPIVAMLLLSTPSTSCQSPSACMIARSSAYAYFVETVVGRSEVYMLRRGARTDPRGTPLCVRFKCCYVCNQHVAVCATDTLLCVRSARCYVCDQHGGIYGVVLRNGFLA